MPGSQVRACLHGEQTGVLTPHPTSGGYLLGMSHCPNFLCRLPSPGDRGLPRPLPLHLLGQWAQAKAGGDGQQGSRSNALGARWLPKRGQGSAELARHPQSPSITHLVGAHNSVRQVSSKISGTEEWGPLSFLINFPTLPMHRIIHLLFRWDFAAGRRQTIRFKH